MTNKTKYCIHEELSHGSSSFMQRSVLFSRSLNLAPIIAASPINFPGGYYDSNKLGEIYNEGTLHGSIATLIGNITYTLVHQHIDGSGQTHDDEAYYTLAPGGCYTQQSTYQYQKWEAVGSHTVHHNAQRDCYYTDCDGMDGDQPKPGGRQCDEHCTEISPAYDETVIDYGWVTYTGTCYIKGCGKTWHQSDGTVSIFDEIRDDQKIVSIKIDMN